jgi:hypothetical protein
MFDPNIWIDIQNPRQVKKRSDGRLRKSSLHARQERNIDPGQVG